MNLYGETPAGKRYTITIRMKDYTEIDAFQKDLVDLTGTADIRFYSYARGVWDPMTRTRIGYESPVRERYTMPVHVVFENGRVTVETGPELDIFAEFTNNRFVYRNN